MYIQNEQKKAGGDSCLHARKVPAKWRLAHGHVNVSYCVHVHPVPAWVRAIRWSYVRGWQVATFTIQGVGLAPDVPRLQCTTLA